MASYCMGLDVGGGSVRALVLEAATGRVWSAARRWRPFGALGTGGLGMDLDPEEVWSALRETCADALAASGAAPGQVRALAATTMRFGTIILDGAGEPLYAAPNRDARAAGEAFGLAARHGEALQARTGLWPMPLCGVARLMWLRARRPEAFARAHAALALDDWIAWRLCGELATTSTQASVTGVLDLESRGWAEDWIAALELPRGVFPRIVESGTRLGALGSAAARELGLPAGICVAAGGGDTQCALLGTGAISPGHLAIAGGTTVPVMAVLGAPARDPAGRLWAAPGCVPGTWVLESNAGPMGEALDWTARLLFPEVPHAVARLLAAAGESEPGARGLLSTFGVEIHDARGMRLPNGHLSLSHLTRPDEPRPGRHVARAVVEGVAFGVRANRDQIGQALGGLPATSHTHFCGGLSQSASLGALLSDVLGVPLRVGRSPEASALGAALCAGVGAGIWPDLASAVAATAAREAAEIRPDPERSQRLAALYETWSRARELQTEARAAAARHQMPWVLASTDATARAPRASRKPLRILATADLDAGARARLSALGALEYASYRDELRLLTGPALVEALRGFQVFVTEVDIVDAAVLAELPELRVVAACRGEAVNVDVEACSAYGIPVLSAPGRNADAVADLTIAFLLLQARKLMEACAFLRAPDVRAGDMGKMGQAFSILRGHELGGRCVGLVGLGAVGRAVARRLVAFGARILCADPRLDREAAAAAGAELVPLDALLAESDFVSLHASVSEATRGLIGRAELARMKPGAFLVNTARGALVDEEALTEALASGHLAGAALDTFAVEPPGADHPLLKLEGVIATPHVGGNSFEVSGHQGRIVAGALADLVRGARPGTLLNPAAADGFDWESPRPAPSPGALARLADRPPPAVSDLQRDARREPAARAARGPVRAAVEAPADLVKGMERVIDAFLEDLRADPAVAAFASGRDVTLHFTLPDLGIQFYFQLRDGGVRAERCAPEEPAEVSLWMRSAILDGMFLGSLNAMEAAMRGDISFSGDAAKAMTLQHLQPELQRLYAAARERAGDPGDLASLPAGGVARSPAEPRDPREEIVAVMRELYASELITATGGNVSARGEDPDEIWITPSQLFKGDLRADAMVRIDRQGRPLDEGARSPSSEASMHCAIYRTRPEVRAVIHAHAPHATILANARLPFLPISTEAAFFGDIPRIPFIMPGTGELAQAVAEAMQHSWACMMVNHGLVVAARSLRRAADMVEIIDRSAELILGCYAVGREPPTLPAAVVEMLRQMGDLVA